MPVPLVALPCGSRSTSSTCCSCAAREAARFTAVVVFPTPPFWFTTASTSAMRPSPPWSGASTTRVRHRSRNRAPALGRNFVRVEGFRPPRPARIFTPDINRGASMKIACVLGQGFEDSEFRIPFDRLKKEGYEVEIIGLKAGEELKGYKGKETVRADKGIDQVKADDYDALLIPGGQSPDHLRVDKRMVEFVRQFDEQGKLIAAVCHGPQLLMA